MKMIPAPPGTKGVVPIPPGKGKGNNPPRADPPGKGEGERSPPGVVPITPGVVPIPPGKGKGNDPPRASCQSPRASCRSPRERGRGTIPPGKGEGEMPTTPGGKGKVPIIPLLPGKGKGKKAKSERPDSEKEAPEFLAWTAGKEAGEREADNRWRQKLEVELRAAGERWRVACETLQEELPKKTQHGERLEEGIKLTAKQQQIPQDQIRSLIADKAADKAARADLLQTLAETQEMLEKERKKHEEDQFALYQHWKKAEQRVLAMEQERTEKTVLMQVGAGEFWLCREWRRW